MPSSGQYLGSGCLQEEKSTLAEVLSLAVAELNWDLLYTQLLGEWVFQPKKWSN